MERRKILLGSGAALTTALAGCTGSGGDDDDPDDDETESTTDNGSENGNESTENGDADDTDDSDPEESDGADIPGFDGSKLDIESDVVSITSIERTDSTVEVVATSEITDLQKLYAELGTLADAHKNAITDLEAFEGAIDTIDWVVDHDEKKVISFSVKTEWLVNYKNGDLSADAFLEKVKATAE